MEMVLSKAMELTLGNKTQLAHEPDNLFMSYYEQDERLDNAEAYPDQGQFVDLVFAHEPRMITPHKISDFGVKSFPRMGAYAYYTPLHEANSYMVIPIHKKHTQGDPPTVHITDTGTIIKVAIEGDYECYRIIVRQDYLAEEFVTYTSPFEFIPMFTGSCLITVLGHSNEISVTSRPVYIEMELEDRT